MECIYHKLLAMWQHWSGGRCITKNHKSAAVKNNICCREKIFLMILWFRDTVMILFFICVSDSVPLRQEISVSQHWSALQRFDPLHLNLHVHICKTWAAFLSQRSGHPPGALIFRSAHAMPFAWLCWHIWFLWFKTGSEKINITVILRQKWPKNAKTTVRTIEFIVQRTFLPCIVGCTVSIVDLGTALSRGVFQKGYRILDMMVSFDWE